MSKRLKIFIAIYCLIIVFLCIYVPWKYKGKYVGYAFMWNMPKYEHYYSDGESLFIDLGLKTYAYAQVYTQWMLLSIISLSALFVAVYNIELDKKLYRFILIIKKALK